MQPVPALTLEVAAVHAVIGLEVADDRLNGLTPPEQLSLLLADPFGLAPVHDVHIRVVCIHTPITQIHERCRWLRPAVLHQDRGLFQLLIERVPVVRVAVEGFGPHDQVTPQCAGNAQLHAELVGCSGLAL